MSVCLSDGVLSNNFVKVPVSVHVPVCPKNLWIQHYYPQNNFLDLSLIFFGSLANETFSNFKFNVFIITGSIFSNKYVKQVVLINHGWISPTLQKGWRLEFCLFFKKWERLHFFPKKGEVAKIVYREIKVAEG